MNEKKPYEKPTLEITEFLLEDSIAASGQGAGLLEEEY